MRQCCTNADATRDQQRIQRTATIPRLICILAHHHTHTHKHTHSYMSSHLYRCAAPLNQRGLGDRTPASGKVQSQLHSACRQTTLAKPISEKTVVAEVRSHVFVLRTRVPGHPSTVLQGTGPAVSVPHTRTHALDLSVCMPSESKVVCHALAVADVNRGPCGLFPALLQESGMCATRTFPPNVCMYYSI
jgi:hypothetical protein